MTTRSRIEWTEHTWNPVIGCTKISAGCKFCYAEVMAKRLKAMGTSGYEAGFKLRILPQRLNEPLERMKPTIYFVNSMSDLFHTKVPNSYIDQVFEVMSKASHHVFQVLTKRADRLASYTHNREIPDNIWLGTTVENLRHGVPRIAQLRQTPCMVRFLSIEPLLEDIGELNLEGIGWVIVGGESGPQARPMEASWVRNIQRQCRKFGVDFFFKQWGTYGADGQRRSKKANGREFDGRTWNDMPAPTLSLGPKGSTRRAISTT